MNKAIDKTILVSIFIVPLASAIPMRGSVVWYPELLALMCMGFIFMAMLFWNTNKFITIFMIYLIFSYLFVCGQSPRSMLCLITGYCGMMVTYFVSRSDVSVKWALIIICLINILLVVLQIFNIDPFFTPINNNWIDRIVGFVGSRNQNAIFHSSIAVLLMSYSPWLIILSIPAFIIKCSSAVFGFFVGINTFLLLRGFKKISLILFIIIIASSIYWIKFGSKSNEIKERMNLWGLTISQSNSGRLADDTNSNRVIKSNPYTGFGLGNFFVFSPISQQGIMVRNNTSHRYEHAHNDLIESKFEFGHIGFALIILCIISVLLEFIQCLHLVHPNNINLTTTFSALVAISTMSMGVYVFHAPVSFFLFCLILGLFYREVRHAKQGTVS